jgi:hypothetical protein
MSSVVRQRGLFAQAVPRLEHVLERCPARRVRVILRTRRQDAYLESVYLQRVRMGSTESWDAFMAHVDVERLSWLDLVNRLSDLLGPSQVGVRPFEEIRHGARPYLRRFLADAGLTPDASFEFSTGTQNRGYSEPALRIGLVANQVLEAHDRKQLRHYLDQHLSTRTHPRAVLMSDDQRREMLRGLERDNELVMAMTGPPTDVSYSPAALVS